MNLYKVRELLTKILKQESVRSELRYSDRNLLNEISPEDNVCEVCLADLKSIAWKSTVLEVRMHYLYCKDTSI